MIFIENFRLDDNKIQTEYKYKCFHFKYGETKPFAQIRKWRV